MGKGKDKKKQKRSDDYYRNAQAGSSVISDHRGAYFMTEVKDQPPGGCWVTSTIDNLEMMYSIKFKRDIKLSQQQLINVVSHSYPGKKSPETALKYIYEHGVVREVDCPLIGEHVPNAEDPKGPRLFINYYGVLSNWDDISTRLQSHPLIAHAKIGVTSIRSIRNDKIHMPIAGEKIAAHAIVLVGEGFKEENGDIIPYYTYKNSWGTTTWGDHGYGRIHKCQVMRVWFVELRDVQDSRLNG